MILEPTSLALTLRNLEQCRLAGSGKVDPEVPKTLDWIVSRGAFLHNGPAVPPASQSPTMPRPRYFAATERDLVERVPMPTDEHARRDCTRSILGFEAARALILWGRTHDWPAEKVIAHIRNKRHTWPPPRPGHYCCEKCSVGRWRVLAAAQPTGWKDVVSSGLLELEEQAFEEGQGWHKYPFYYALLTMSEISLPGVNRLRKVVRPTARRLLSGLSTADVNTSFRVRALEWAAG